VRRIESFLESVLEGLTGRLFRSPLQPAEVARKLERAMEENYVVAADGVMAPNAYDVLLHPQDLKTFADSRAELVAQLEHWLGEVAREERYRFVGPVRVRLLGDDGVARRAILVRAAIVEAEFVAAGADDATVFTRDYRVVRTTAGSAACRLKILTGPQAGQVFVIGGKTATIGRGLDNDLTIESADVSRRHARLEQVDGGYRLIDLNSTNGTLVNGRRVTEHYLAPGDTLTLGATEVSFQVSDTAPAPGRGQPRDSQRS
jgi:hypothetical protein